MSDPTLIIVIVVVIAVVAFVILNPVGVADEVTTPTTTKASGTTPTTTKASGTTPGGTTTTTTPGGTTTTTPGGTTTTTPGGTTTTTPGSTTTSTTTTTTTTPRSTPVIPYTRIDYAQGGMELEMVAGSLKTCQDNCSSKDSCVGFSRSSTASDTDVVNCFLKTDTPSLTRFAGFQSYIKNSKLPQGWSSTKVEEDRQICDGTSHTLCPDGQEIESGKIKYGRWINGVCPGPGVPIASILSKEYNLIPGTTSLQNITTYVNEDPLPNVAKHYEVLNKVCRPKVQPTRSAGSFTKISWAQDGLDFKEVNKTLLGCRQDCEEDSTCVGFARRTTDKDSDIAKCFLKNGIPNLQPIAGFQSFIKDSKLPAGFAASPAEEAAQKCEGVDNLLCPAGQEAESGTIKYGRWINTVCPGQNVPLAVPVSRNFPLRAGTTLLNNINQYVSGQDPAPGVRKHYEVQNLKCRPISNILSGTYSIKGNKNSKFCTSQTTIGTWPRCDKDSIADSEKFIIKNVSGDDYTITSVSSGKLAGTGESFGRVLDFNPPGGAANFKIVPNGAGYTIQTLVGSVLKYGADDGNVIRFNRDSIGAWETFDIKRV